MFRPSLFIGSSSEGLDAARAVRAQLSDVTEVTVWNEGVFDLSRSALDSLLNAVPRFRYAVLVFTPDDIITSRKKREMSPRDNVIFECGLCVGALGRDRTFLVVPRDLAIKLPSDLSGITMAPYMSNRSDGNTLAALGEACDLIRMAIKRHMQPAETDLQPAVEDLGDTESRLTVWVLGSYQGLDENTRNAASRIAALLGSALAQARARVVAGESDLLRDLVESYRDTNLSRPDRALNPIVLPGRLLEKDMRSFFLDAIGRVPDVAIVLGGGTARGRVRSEIQGAVVAQIPLLPVPRAGGVGARTMANPPALATHLSGLAKNADTAEIVIAIMRTLGELRKGAK